MKGGSDSPLLQYYKGEEGMNIVTVVATLQAMRFHPILLCFPHPLRALSCVHRVLTVPEAMQRWCTLHRVVISLACHWLFMCLWFWTREQRIHWYLRQYPCSCGVRVSDFHRRVSCFSIVLPDEKRRTEQLAHCQCNCTSARSLLFRQRPGFCAGRQRILASCRFVHSVRPFIRY